jgi:hypothetical protein
MSTISTTTVNKRRRATFLAMFLLSFTLSITLSGSRLSITGNIGNMLIQYFSLNNYSELSYIITTRTIDFIFYLFSLYTLTEVTRYSVSSQLVYREVTRSEAKLRRAAPSGSAADLLSAELPSSRSAWGSTTRARAVVKHELIAENLNTRVLALQARATMMYWTIIMTLAMGVILVVFSGYLSSYDTAGSQLWSRIDSEMTQVYRPSISTPSSTPLTDGDAVKRLNEHYDQVLKAAIADLTARNNQGRVWNWPSTIMRVSVAGLLIFLVQILIQLYRYNSRLIAFYSSRRDAIIMSDGDLDAAKQWEAVFAPANLDFGREPRHPFQAVANLFGRGKFSDQESTTDEEADKSDKQQNKKATGQARPAPKKPHQARRSGTLGSVPPESGADPVA